MNLTESDRERFWSYVSVPVEWDDEGCWLWTGATTSRGYGSIHIQGKPRTAHRVSLQIWDVEIPTGMDVRHTCDVRRCVRPDHLLLGTREDNMRDAVERGRLARGEAHGRTTLTEAEVRGIRWAVGPLREIASWYDTTISTASRIRRRDTWGHI